MLLPYFYTAPNVALVNLAMEIGTADLKFRTVVALARESRKVAADFASGLDLASVQGRKPLIARSVEIIPAGSNRFQRGEPCLAFLEIYEPLLSGPNPPKLSLQIRILDRQTGERKVDSGVFGVDNLVRAGDQVVPVSLTVPIATLSPGGYRLEVKATRSPGTDSAIRLADFDVQ